MTSSSLVFSTRFGLDSRLITLGHFLRVGMAAAPLAGGKCLFLAGNPTGNKAGLPRYLLSAGFSWTRTGVILLVAAVLERASRLDPHSYRSLFRVFCRLGRCDKTSLLSRELSGAYASISSRPCERGTNDGPSRRRQ